MKRGYEKLILGTSLAVALAVSPVSFAAAAGSSAPAAAASTASVPVSGSGAGQADQQTSGCETATMCFSVGGAGRGSPMPSASLSGLVGFFQNNDPTTGRVSGQVTLVDVNNQQNKVFANIEGDAVLTPTETAAPTQPTATAPAPFANVAIAGTYVVTGGEGVYQGATGSGPASGNGRVSSNGNLYQVVGALVNLGGAIQMPDPVRSSPVPTLSQWALLLLAGLLAAVGFRRYQRRGLMH